MDDWIVLAIILLLCLWLNKSTFERMTNSDLLKTLGTFQKTGIKPKKTDPHEEPIYGPKVPKLEEPAPSSSKHTPQDTNEYPDIYGPEIETVPGTKSKHASGKQASGKHSSDSPDNETYEFNPDLKKAFPTDQDEPQPFLTDYSKFQH